jgi:hypothetical protein
MSKINEYGPPIRKELVKEFGSEMDSGRIYRGLHLQVFGWIQLRKTMIS